MTARRVLHVAASDADGGAARAAYRLHQALSAHAGALGFRSEMLVCHKGTDDPTVIEARAGHPSRVRASWRYHLHRWRTRGFSTESDALHSIAWPATGLGAELTRQSRDVLHLHWLGRNTLSVEEIGALRGPIVWTMHDMWSFCGAEHYADDRRYLQGYARGTRPAHETGPDLNRWTWRRKAQAWRTPMHLVAPSAWLRDCAQRSALLGDWPCTVIPNPLDLAVLRPMDKREARAKLGLKPDVSLVLFGALGGTADRRKGADLLLAALAELRAPIAGQLITGPESRESFTGRSMPAMQLMVFGAAEAADRGASFNEVAADLDVPMRWAGVLRDNDQLRLHYSAADVVVVPSRMDNLPQTATEAMACGTPVVAFRLGGLPDIVQHGTNGYLAEPLDPASLAEGVRWALTDENRRRALADAARATAEQRWAPAIVARQYADVYREVLVPTTPARGTGPETRLAPKGNG